MNKELQNKAWAVLPKDFKEEVRREYKMMDIASNEYVCGTISLFERIFGINNLTSDAEEAASKTKPRFKIGDKVTVRFIDGKRIAAHIYEVMVGYRLWQWANGSQRKRSTFNSLP